MLRQTNNIEKRRILVINSPTRDKGGFKGSPTSMLYAIGPLVEEIKAKNINISGFSHLNIFDPTYFSEDLNEQLEKKLREIEPHIVTISTTSDSFHIAEKMAKIVKDKAPYKNTIVIVGGPHCDEVDFNAPENPNNPLVCSNSFDFVISGDGEYMLLTLVQMIVKGMQKLEDCGEEPNANAIKNYVLKNAKAFNNVEGYAKLYFKVNNKIKSIASSMKQIDLNKLPPLRYEYLKKEHLKDFDIFRDEKNQIKKCVQVMTHRGCKAYCSFCSERVLTFDQMGLYYNNTKTVDTVIKEIQHYVDKLGVQAIFFDDSTFLEDPIFVKELCKRMIETGLSRRIKWGCLNRFDKVDDPALIGYMAKAGLDYMYLGLELFDDESLIKMNKVRNKRKLAGSKMTKVILNALKILKDNNVRVGVSILFGLPFASEDVEIETIKFVGRMVDEKKISLVSLSLFNYHLVSFLSLSQRQLIMLDYFNVKDKIDKQNKPPWNCFEEGGWFHATKSRLIDENYLARLIWAVDRYIRDKNTLVRKREIEEFIKSSWGKKLLDEPAAFSLIQKSNHITISDFTVVGNYVRGEEDALKKLRYVCSQILSGLSERKQGRQHWLFWGAPGFGKTSFIEQIGEVAKQQKFTYRRLDLSDPKVTENSFKSALSELLEKDTSVLCFIDEIAAKPDEIWPYETIKSFMDVVEEKSLPITVVLAGSRGANIDELKNHICSRHMGKDMLRRVSHQFSVPEMSISDKIIIALASIAEAGKSAGTKITAVEKLALFWMVLSPKLENAGQLRDYATIAVERMLRSKEQSLMYKHLFDPYDPEKTRFEGNIKHRLTDLTEKFVYISY
jgi:radical SAM superfamily enzyme YgiQ (UPF0313 family)